MTYLTTDEPKRKHRSTIYRAAQRLVRQCEGNSAGVYWSAETLAAWHADDLTALADRVAAADAGVQAMMIRGELCWHLEP
ncbi:hypothetical protein HER21_28690 [Pseudomonas sp. BGM005]|nr:hypothetical protein [Pseudomonas sp. BG5]